MFICVLRVLTSASHRQELHPQELTSAIDLLKLAREAREAMGNRTGRLEEVDQRSDVWLQLRSGCISGSVAHMLVLKGRGSKKNGNSTADAAGKVVIKPPSATCVRAVFGLQENVTTEAMRFGIDNEAAAINTYVARRGGHLVVRRGGFFIHRDPAWHYLVASPDGIAMEGKEEVLLEVKCKAPSKGRRAVLKKMDTCPTEYYAQIQHCLFTIGLNKAVLLVFNGEDLETVEVPADEAWLAKAKQYYEKMYATLLCLYWQRDWKALERKLAEVLAIRAEQCAAGPAAGNAAAVE
jgi:hypothetical protein